MRSLHQKHLDAAEDWLLRLQWGSATPADREAFSRWFAVPEHAQAYARAEKLWRAFDRVAADQRVEEIAGQILVDAASRGHWQGSRLTLALAASVSIAVIAAAGFAVLQKYAPTATYATETGERSTIRLDDGSQAILNSATRLKVKLDRNKRQFTLVEGEAVFAVAEDPHRPFTVSAGGGNVTALGTRFQVRNESKRVTVTLLEGRIAVDREDTGQHMQLAPGEQVRFSTGEDEMERHAVDPEVVSSWTTGRLQFHSTPLAQVLDEVNRYARMQIRLDDPSLGAMPVNGTFEIGDSASLVSALSAAFPIEAVPRGAREIVLRQREQSGS